MKPTQVKIRQMTSQTDEGRITHATPESLLEFCNAVRACGNASLLDALLPSTAGSAEKCLIARALNFSSNVEVGAKQFADGSSQWIMFPSTKTTVRWRFKSYENYVAARLRNLKADNDKARALAKATGLRLATDELYLDGQAHERVGLALPKLIGNAASAFDADAVAFQKWSRA